MANFFGGFFKQMEKPQSVHPPSVSHEFSQYDSEYIKYCIEQEQTISNLETCLHTTDDPKEIAMKTLKRLAISMELTGQVLLIWI